MKRFLIVFFFCLIRTVDSFSCDCDWSGDFLTAGLMEDLVVKVKIIEHLKEDQDINEKMTVQVIEKYKGHEINNSLTIWGDNGNECRPYVDYFNEGQYYLLALTKFGTDYEISNCGEYYLSIDDGKVRSERNIRPELPQVGEMDLAEFEKIILDRL